MGHTAIVKKVLIMVSNEKRSVFQKIFKRLFSDKDDHEEIVQNMKAKMFSENTLKTIIETDNLHL